ncbi:MAG: CHAP domain-containing protein, partial [Lachnospiraceae bacterium]|nr:CHAP domain-containing protein [Lachnospiraceae bacterium]
MIKKNFDKIVIVWMCILTIIFMEKASINRVYAAAPNGIAGNGLAGISIDVNAAPYTEYANIPQWGQYAYGPAGCAWFASARVKQLTGKGDTIYSGASWYNSAYAKFQFSRGSTLKAPAIACYSGHVAIVEKIVGDTVYISEGGMSGYGASASTGYTVIRAVNKTEMWHAGAESSNTLLGYVYLGDIPDPISEWTTSVSDITTTNAKVSAKYTASSSVQFQWAGCNFFDMGGNLIAQAGETTNVSGTYINIWYDITGETHNNIILSQGTTYQYQFYVTYNGVDHFSPMYTFTTEKSSDITIPDPVIPDETSRWTTSVSDITTTNAKVSAKYTGSSSVQFQWVGCNFFDMSGNLIAQAGETT